MSSAQSDDVAVTLPQGTYTGYDSDGVTTYHNVPYAQPFRRFESPSAVEPGTGQFISTSFGAICPQLPSRLEIATGPLPPGSGPQDEYACARLSIYCPSTRIGDQHLPVLVWIHGGAFVTGASQIPWYTGTSMARESNILVVSVQYRLGAFGYLYNATSTAEEPGTQDVILALDWIKQNIASFGGDAENVTLMGQSAGAYLISLIGDVRPDLFRRAVLTSSPAGIVLSETDASRVRQSLEKALPSGKTVFTATTQEILNAQGEALKQNTDLNLAFAPIRRDGTTPGGRTSPSSAQQRAKQYLIGWTKGDAAVFVELRLQTYNIPQLLRAALVPLLTPAFTRSQFINPNRQLSDRLRTRGHEVANFEHTWKPPGYAFGATHTVDVPLSWGNREAWKEAPIIGDKGFDEWERRGKLWRAAIGRFVADGIVPGAVEGVQIER